MKKTVLFFILERYADWEGSYLSALLLALAGGKFDVKTLSLKKRRCQIDRRLYNFAGL